MILAPLVLSLAVLAGGNDPILLPPISPDPLAPRTLAWPVLYTGDPVPGIPNATITELFTPQIDGAGRVFVYARFRPIGQSVVRRGLWFGEPGALALIAYEGMQAHGMPPGVTYEYIYAGASVSENGWIALTARLAGPGIVGGVNDIALFAGPPGDIRKVLQGGDAPPDVEPGTFIDVNHFGGTGLTPWLSDNATMLVIAWVRGPAVNGSNDRAMWIGPRENLRLIWRRGMEAPGTDGARFDWEGFVKFNDSGQIVFRGELFREGDVTALNDTGYWTGTTQGLTKLARGGDQAVGLPLGVSYRSNGTSLPSLNAWGDVTYWMALQGTGVTDANDEASWVRVGEETRLLVRKGDPVLMISPKVEIDSPGGNNAIAQSRHLYYRVKFRGPGITVANAWGIYFGPQGATTLSLRDGDTAPWMGESIILTRVVSTESTMTMNDAGSIAVATETTGPSITSANKSFIWLFDSIRNRWSPLIRGNIVIGSDVVVMTSADSMWDAYATITSGSDGGQQGLGDSRQLAIRLDLSNGTHAVFVLALRWWADPDDDGDVDWADFGTFQRCAGDLPIAVSSECHYLDIDSDGDVDVMDFDNFLDMVTGPG